MTFILSAVITLFLVMDPFGNIPVFLAVLRKVAPERRAKILMRELVIALVIMIAFMFLGKQFLALLKIEQFSLSIAGGLLLFIISLKLVFGNDDEEGTKASAKDEEPFIVPLAVPLVAGPAALSTTLILSAQTDHKSLILIAVLIASLLNYLILMLSFPISNLLGKRGLVAIERLMGMILVVMSVNMIMNGIAQFLGR
ncbi:multiple antibiotic resistance protein [Elusimicrobium posterum]|uniref:MarC family protein n=1 Tax=Elusimicrobium posterum TaxID=3116653 RepID=UPI003C71F980